MGIALRRPVHRRRRIVLLAGAAASLATVAALAGCSASPSPHSATAAASTAPAAPVAATTEDCASQVADWQSQGGATALSTLGDDVSTMGTDMQALASDLSLNGEASAADESTVQSDAATVQGDAQAVEASPGPSCIPGMSADASAAARYYTVAAIDADNSITQLSAGNYETADDEIRTSTTAIDEGNAKIKAATADVTAFSGS